MRKKVIRRSSEGKTLIVEVEVEGGEIKEVHLSGDFFAFPPELFDEMESSLRGLKADVHELRRALEPYERKVQLVGITLGDVREALAEALAET